MVFIFYSSKQRFTSMSSSWLQCCAMILSRNLWFSGVC